MLKEMSCALLRLLIAKTKNRTIARNIIVRMIQYTITRGVLVVDSFAVKAITGICDTVTNMLEIIMSQ